MNKKQCNKCKKIKILGLFIKDKSIEGGIGAKCQECRKKYDRIRNQKLKRRFYKYKHDAIRRDLSFRLSLKQFFTLTSLPCTYCGDFSHSTYDNSKFNFCGIDRLNPKTGYYMKNVVPCCRTCNIMKMKLSYKEFVTIIKKISRHIL